MGLQKEGGCIEGWKYGMVSLKILNNRVTEPAIIVV